VLDGIDPRRTLLWFDAGLLAPRWADAFERWLDAAHTTDSPESAVLGRGPSHGGVIYDPFTPMVGTGALQCDVEAAFRRGRLRMRTGLLRSDGRLSMLARGPMSCAGAVIARSCCVTTTLDSSSLTRQLDHLTLPIAGRAFQDVASFAPRGSWAVQRRSRAPRELAGIHATSSITTRHGVGQPPARDRG
jgi:methylmalonyl-CoA mutase